MSEPKPAMFHVGLCRVCDAGPLGLRTCGGCGRVLLLCDECDAVWLDAETGRPPRFHDDPDPPCPHCEASLIAAPSHWATRDEIDAEAWVVEAVAAAKLVLERGEPLGPAPGDP